MIYPKPLTGALSRETYLEIVEAIYLQHYARWYSMHGDNYERDYEKRARALLSRLTEQIKLPTLKVNGIKHIPAAALTAIPHGPHRLTMQIAFAFGVALLALTITLVLRKVFGLDTFTLIEIFVTTLVAFFAIAALFDARAYKIFKEMLQLLRGLLANDHNVAGARPNARNKTERGVRTRKPRRDVADPK